MEAIAAAASAAGAHPSPEQLLGYHDGELEAAERERVVWHLAACAECTQAVLDMARFPEVEALDPRQRLSATDVAERWRRLRDRLRREPPAEHKAPVVELKPRSRSWVSSLGFARAAAAVLLVVTVALSATVLSMRRRAQDDAGPRLNLPIFELAASAVGERAEETSQTLRVPAGADGALLVLTLVDPRTHPGYRVEIRDASAPPADPIWDSSDLQRSAEGIFTIEIRRGFLPAGRYQIEVRGLDGDRSELLAAYLLALEYE